MGNFVESAFLFVIGVFIVLGLITLLWFPEWLVVWLWLGLPVLAFILMVLALVCPLLVRERAVR
ncbi:hypothetical protein COT52_01540 [candidate division WWE3 bacterium CG08_land_8_20_14_0_20_43_13]|uniref:DUF4175 domain-containing protein n=1 Tax=candidate division WWE3 bacterium CG08_land_8_20_14_0_20_43_13 TaxID=1975087 RepID=A0A2H0X7F7_UNCKA|nr:MAG: hypothetical protein COT52_01540 [candidate division WWE3 bacterium CG08_land_8_20_14_0_20_43_13]